jgi:glycosyltransferase involved in cell wall biosynthesis
VTDVAESIGQTGDETIHLGPQQVGEQVLGPIYAEFFSRLHAFSRPHDPAVRRLFVARAGVRLRNLYHVFCSARGLQPADSQVLWTSRLLATKALYGVDDDLFFRSVLKEFKNGTIRDFANALTRRGEPLHLGPLRKEPVDRMRQLLADGRMMRLHAFLASEAELARAYHASRLGGGPGPVFLIDSGWHGTIHRLLMPNTEAELTSLLVARVRREGEDAPPNHQVVGLVLEADSFDPLRPESALVFHRHLVEAPLEPPCPSIERVVRDSSGSFSFPEAAQCETVDVSQARDRMYLGIEAHLRKAGGSTAYETQSAFVKAVEHLASSILYPRADDVTSLDMGLRSSDFGRSYSAPVLLDPLPRYTGDTADNRIRDSLWAQGQAVVELGEQGARNVHRNLAGRLSQEDYFHPWRRRLAERAHGRVAVVTRTKDRPILLRRAARSVASQSYPELTWVIVNDGGQIDPVLDVVRDSSVRRSAVTIISNEESIGMEAASNLGATAVDSDFLAIHDDDDSWDARFLEETVGFLRERAGDYVGVVTHTTYVSEEIVDGQVVTRRQQPYNGWLRSINLAEMSGGNLFAPIAFVFTRDVYEAAGRFPENLPVLGDWDFNLRVLTKGDIGVLPKPLAFYHHRDVGASVGYGNSVIAAREKHLEFDAKVRNELYRRIGEGGELGHLALIGYTLKTLRDEIRLARAPKTAAAPAPAPASVPGQPDGMDPDLLWWALVAALRRSGPGTGGSLVDSVTRRLRRRTGRTEPDTTATLVPELMSELPVKEVPCPPDFNEAAYLRRNPDVRRVVKDPNGSLSSGWEHYLLYGKRENRPRPTRRKPT